MEILDCPDGVSRCASIVKRGGVVVFPTDTVYGIGCDPYNDDAVTRIFSIKGRVEGKPLPVLASGIESAQKLVRLCKVGTLLAKKFWPGALTIVAPLADHKISTGVLAGRKSLAVRVPAGACTLGLLSLCRYLVGTSANPSGMPSPKTAQEVSLTGYDAILVDTTPAVGKESTIVDITGHTLEIIREGAISAQEIHRVAKL